MNFDCIEGVSEEQIKELYENMMLKDILGNGYACCECGRCAYSTYACPASGYTNCAQAADQICGYNKWSSRSQYSYCWLN